MVQRNMEDVSNEIRVLREGTHRIRSRKIGVRIRPREVYVMRFLDVVSNDGF